MVFDEILSKRENKTRYRVGGYTVKVFEDDYPVTDIFSEALNNTRAQEVGLKVPEVFEISRYEGKWTLRLRYIKGDKLSDMIEKDLDNAEDYIRDIVTLQTEVHSKQSRKLTMLTDLIKRNLSQTSFDSMTRYDLQIRLESMPKNYKMCNCNFIPSNIIISDDDHSPYRLDWRLATQGNASADAVMTYLYLLYKYKDKVAELYLDMFCEISKIEKWYVKRWIPIIAAAQTVNANEDQKRFLFGFVDVRKYW